MSTYNPKESLKKDVRTSDSDEDQDHDWDGDLLRAVHRKIGKCEKEPEEVTLTLIKNSLDGGANINVQGRKDDTALHVVIKKDYRRTVQVLLERGAKTDIPNCNKQTALDLAESLQKKDILDILRKHIEQLNEPGVGRLSGSNIVPVADDQEPSTSRGGAMAIQRKSGKGFYSNEHQDKANESSGSEAEETYEPGATLTKSWPGIVYQLRHLQFTLHCALQQKDPCFHLATEMAEADKLDDVVLMYKNDAGQQVGRFVQIKHASSAERKISAKELLDADGNFSLPRYFTSWRKVKENKLFDKIMIRHMILCTNRGLDLDDLKKKQIDFESADEDPDKSFELKRDSGRTAWYKLREDKESNKKLYDELKQTTDRQKLAKLLATRICDGKDVRIDMKMFKLYHVALAKDVFNPSSNQFHDSFIKNEKLSENVKNFREAFISKFRKIRNDPQINISDKLTWEEIQNLFKKLNLQKNFGQVQESKPNQSTNQKPESNPRSELPEDDYVDDEEIKSFLKEFTLAVNQPGIKELESIISRKIHASSQFNLLNTGILDDIFLTKIFTWFVNKSEQGKRTKYLSYKVSEKFIKSMNEEIDSLLAKGAIPVHCEWIAKYDVHFKFEMQQVKDFLAEGGSHSTSTRILNLVAPEETLLIALKVYDTLKMIPKYEKSDSFIFTRMDSLKLPSNSVKTIFHSQQYPDLLIVYCGSNSTRKYSLTLLDPLYEIIAENEHKKMIVITREGEDLGTQFDLSHETYVEKVENLSFSNLTSDSQKKILGKQVTKFQGQDNKTSFGKLLGIDDCDDLGEVELEDLPKIMDSGTLVQLISGDGIQIGDNIEGSDVIERCYIHRQIFRHVVIRGDILNDDNIPDLFVISCENTIVRAELLRMAQTSSRTRNSITEPCVQGGMDSDVSSELEQTRETSSMGHGTQKLTILDSNRGEGQFNTLCAENKDRNVHWLQWEQESWNKNGYVWKKSQGNITRLVRYRDAAQSKDNHDRTSAKSLRDADLTPDDGPVIISDTAGMGKSTTMTYLASNMKRKEPNMLLLKIDLNRHAAALREVLNDSSYDLRSINGAVEFLVNELLRGEKDNLARKVYERIIKRKHRVILMFDGFDEISPKYEKTVINLLGTLAENGIQKLVVATKPHTRETLETNLNAFSHEMKPFSTQDQKEFFIDFWTAEFEKSNGHTKQRIKERIEKYTTALVKKLDDWINEKGNKFTGNPLQAYLVAEVFGNHQKKAQELFHSVRGFIDSQVDEPDFPKRIDLIYLYEHFVKKKFNDSFKRTGVDSATIDGEIASENCFKKFVDRHTRLALYALVGKNETTELLLSLRKWTDGSSETTTADIVERNGMVTGFIDDQPQFGHQTYAEYFAAKFFTEMLNTRQQDESLGKILVEVVLLRGNYGTLRAFMEWLLRRENIDVLEGEFWSRYLQEFRSIRGETIFHVAAQEGNGRIIRLFLNCLGANTEGRRVLISVKEMLGRTAVHLAAEFGDLGNIEWLIEGSNFDINSQDTTGSTPLQFAAQKGQLDVVKYLLEKDAKIDSRNKKHLTPLHFAALTGKLPVVKCLVGKGAKIDSRSDKGGTPLHAAAEGGELNVVEYLVGKGAEINSRSNDGITPLHAAAVGGELNVVEYLVGKGAEIDSRNEEDVTPLHFAALSGKLDMVQYLVGKGAGIDSRNKDGFTPLHAAAQNGELNVVEYLVGKGAEIDSRDEEDVTPLHIAAREGKLDVVKYLVGKAAEIDSRNKDGFTPLHAAAQEGQLNVVEYLVGKGAEIDSRNKVDSTPLHAAALWGKLNVVEYLVGKGAEIDSRNKVDSTPLHAAALRGKLNVVEYLVGKAAKIDSRSKDGFTPLHAAALEGQLNVVEYLVGKAAEIDSRNKDGFTPLHAAAREGQLNVVEYLVGKGADINSQDENGWTPLRSAVEAGKWDVVRQLLSKKARG